LKLNWTRERQRVYTKGNSKGNLTFLGKYHLAYCDGHEQKTLAILWFFTLGSEKCGRLYRIHSQHGCVITFVSCPLPPLPDMRGDVVCQPTLMPHIVMLWVILLELYFTRARLA